MARENPGFGTFAGPTQILDHRIQRRLRDLQFDLPARPAALHHQPAVLRQRTHLGPERFHRQTKTVRQRVLAPADYAIGVLPPEARVHERPHGPVVPRDGPNATPRDQGEERIRHRSPTRRKFSNDIDR